MPRSKMTRVEQGSPELATAIESHVVPAFRGSGGGYDHECAGCEATLIENVAEGQFHGMVIKCPRCGAYSRAGLAP